ncbi:hypothetical protein Dsin_019024 [Dipteronia sinensis]|uniref:Retrotransposon gag domain-containing protein n=1 Tax=Dipteronia sinensis TaxID=43782 RepID=A0AAE0A7V6_9ROSI|nr:hypothetical protein Dsin_019024 [Dipteronia sinensis]
MSNSRDRSQSSRGVNDLGLENTSVAVGELPSRTPTSTRKDVITSTDVIPGISPDVFWKVQDSLRRVIEDAARQGINITATTNLTSPYQLFTPVFGEHGELEGEREVLLRRIEALERRKGRGNLLIGNSGSLFTVSIRQACFSEKFMMPHVKKFKANTYPQEHDVPIKMLGDQRSRWFGGLTCGSIKNFEELIQAFTKQFMGNIQRRKSISIISTLKQRKDEKLKDYLTRFSQEVLKVHDPNDKAVVSAFVNSLQHNQLSLSLR